MIDTHCHLLHDLDDGPRSLEGSLELARGLVAAGVSTVVCTPHFSRRFPTDHDLAAARLETLVAALAGARVPLKLTLAAEIGSAAAIEAPADELRRRQLSNGYLLVELEPDTPAGVVEVALERLVSEGLMPVFAHPERCRAVRGQTSVLDTARAAGAPVQVVAQSLTGRWGRETAEAAWNLLDTGRVDLLASDAHRHNQAGDGLLRVFEAISSRIGANAFHELTQTHPAIVVGRSAKPRAPGTP